MRLSPWLLCVALALVLTGCKEAQLGGPVTNADISIDLLDQPGASFQSLQTSGRGEIAQELGLLAWSGMDSNERFIRVGNFEVDPTLIEPDRLYLVRASGGEDSDNNRDGRYDFDPAEVAGHWHAIMPGSALLESGNMVSAMTEAAFQYVRADIGFISDGELMALLDEFATLVVSDMTGDGTVDYSDVLRWSRVYSVPNYLGDIALVDTLIDTISSNAREFVRAAAAEGVWRKEPVTARPPSKLNRTRIGGNISGDLILEREMSPYAIEAPMYIDGNLTIEAGVTIEGRGYTVTVYGDLIAGGVPRQRSKLENVNLLLSSLGSSAGSNIRHTDFEDGSIVAKIQQFTFEDNSTDDWRLELRNIKPTDGSTASIERNVFDDSRISFYNRLPARDHFTVNFVNNLFLPKDNTASRIISKWEGPVQNLIVERNSFHPNMRILSGSSGAVLDVRENYWGVESSSDIDFDEVIPDNNSDDSDWSVSIRPLLGSPHPGTPTGT